MQPVYSRLLFAGQITTVGSNVTVYTVPSGHTLLLRRVTASNFSGASNGFYVVTGTGGVSYVVPPIANGAAFDWDTWHVLEATDTLSIYLGAGPFRFWISGQLLTNV